MSEPGFERGYEAHRDAQIKRLAKESTFEERILWLEEALRLVHELGIDYQEQRRRTREREQKGE